MILLTSGAGLVLEVGFAVFCFVDVLLAREAAVRVLPRWGWVVAILVFPVVGSAAYLLSGRPWRLAERGALSGGAAATGGTGAAPTAGGARPAGQRRRAGGHPAGAGGRTPARDGSAGGSAGGSASGDDPSLLVLLSALNDEHEEMLSRWEADLRRREEQLREQQAGVDRG